VEEEKKKKKERGRNRSGDRRRLGRDGRSQDAAAGGWEAGAGSGAASHHTTPPPPIPPPTPTNWYGTPLCSGSFLQIPLIAFRLCNFPFFTHTRAERAKKDALRSALRVSDLLVDMVDGGVQELFVNEKRIEHEARALLTTIARYRKQTDQWLAATNEINSVLKVPCYSRALELPISQVYY